MGRVPVDASKSVLVTGAAGFIGSHVAEALLTRGDTVVGVDNFDPYYAATQKRANLSTLLDSPGFLFVECDVRDERSFDQLASAASFDVVVHLAARAGVRASLREPALYNDINVNGTTVALETSYKHGIPQFVLGSSSSVYGASTRAAFRESDPADRPASPYAATKRAGEIVAHAYHHLYGLEVSCLRFFTVYGPRQRPEMAIHKFARLIDAGEQVEFYGDGNSHRDYTYVADVVAGVLAAVDRPAGYRIYNLGTTATTRLCDLAEMLAERLARPLRVTLRPEQPGDVPGTLADINRAHVELGYEVTTPLDQGLDRFVDWYRTCRAVSAPA
jgi:UDP-glucuronate 4-epimerase